MSRKYTSLEVAAEGYNSLNTDVTIEQVNQYWIDHIGAIQSLMSSINPNDVNTPTLILGAGNCYDFNLPFLADNHKEIWLVDIDKKCIDSAIMRQFENSRPGNIKVYEKDIVGLYKESTDKIVKIMAEKQFDALPKLLKIIKNWNERISYFCPPIFNQKFDFIVSANVSTQLCTLASFLISQVRGSQVCRNQLLHLAHEISKEHVQQINLMLSTEGKAIIASEQYEWADPIKHPLAHRNGIHQYVKDPRDMLHIEIQNRIELSKEAVPGRITEDMLDDFTILEKREWIWTFNDGRHYLVKGWVVQSNS